MKNEHSKKTCCCGGHNIKNHKKNLNHNSTKKRFSIRKNIKFIHLMKFSET